MNKVKTMSFLKWNLIDTLINVFFFVGINILLYDVLNTNFSNGTDAAGAGLAKGYTFIFIFLIFCVYLVYIMMVFVLNNYLINRLNLGNDVRLTHKFFFGIILLLCLLFGFLISNEINEKFVLVFYCMVIPILNLTSLFKTRNKLKLQINPPTL